MPVRLSIGDSVLLYLSDDHQKKAENIQIGVIKYIGFIQGLGMTEYVGIDLVETTEMGHQGTINGVQYFHSQRGHGIHTRISNVIRKLSASEVTNKMQEIITLFKGRLEKYDEALNQREEYIEELKNTQISLRRLLREHGAQSALDALKSTPQNKMNMVSRESPSFTFNKDKYHNTMKAAPVGSVISEDAISIGSGLTDLTLLGGHGKQDILLGTIDEHGLALPNTPTTLNGFGKSPLNGNHSPQSDSDIILHSNSNITSPALSGKFSNKSNITSPSVVGLKSRYNSKKMYPDTEMNESRERIQRRSRKGRARPRGARHRISSSVGSISTYADSYRSIQQSISVRKRSSKKSKRKSSKKYKKTKKKRRKKNKRRKRKQTERTEFSGSSSSELTDDRSISDSTYSSDSYDDNYQESHSPTPHSSRKYIRNHMAHPAQMNQTQMNRMQHVPPPIQRPLPIQPRPLPVLGNRMHINGALLHQLSPTSPVESIGRRSPQGSPQVTPQQSWTYLVNANAASPNELSLSANNLQLQPQLQTRQRHGHGPLPNLSSPNLTRAQSQMQQQQQQQQRQQHVQQPLQRPQSARPQPIQPPRSPVPQQQQTQMQRPQSARPQPRSPVPHQQQRFMQPVPELRKKQRRKNIAKNMPKNKPPIPQRNSKDSHRRSVSWNPTQGATDEQQIQQNNVYHTQQQHMIRRQQPLLGKPSHRQHVVQYSMPNNNSNNNNNNNNNQTVYFPQPQLDNWIQKQQQIQSANYL